MTGLSQCDVLEVLTLYKTLCVYKYIEKQPCSYIKSHIYNKYSYYNVVVGQLIPSYSYFSSLYCYIY